MDDTLLIDLYKAYFSARKNKRNTLNALKFELNFEQSIIDLHDEIINYNYIIKPSICFMVNKPVKREIFAADFRDRIVHHLIFNYLNPFCERIFIHDSYSCREEKGTLYGIKRIDHFIRSCSNNYKRDCYILKLDIKGYFMSIDKHILFKKVIDILQKCQDKISFDERLITYLIEKTIFNDPTKDCIVRGNMRDWKGLPPSKSLFYAGKDVGLAIGNLTSQMFSNIYLNDFDHFVKKKLKIKYYGRYVDDFVIVHPDKTYLQTIIFWIREFLEEKLLLELHPKKIYLQNFTKGVHFLGAYIKPWRIYTGNRSKANFYNMLHNNNLDLLSKKGYISNQEINHIQSSINSYLGLMIHYNTYRLRRRVVEDLIIRKYANLVKTNTRYKKVIFEKLN